MEKNALIWVTKEFEKQYNSLEENTQEMINFLVTNFKETEERMKAIINKKTGEIIGINPLPDLPLWDGVEFVEVCRCPFCRGTGLRVLPYERGEDEKKIN